MNDFLGSDLPLLLRHRRQRGRLPRVHGRRRPELQRGRGLRQPGRRALRLKIAFSIHACVKCNCCDLTFCLVLRGIYRTQTQSTQKLVVQMKDELEKIKEQLLNVL